MSDLVRLLPNVLLATLLTLTLTYCAALAHSSSGPCATGRGCPRYSRIAAHVRQAGKTRWASGMMAVLADV